MSEISISRDGQELDAWSTVDIQRMLNSGVLSGSDFFWQEGMDEWSTLEHFAPPPSTDRTFPVTFGGARAVDQLGFVRTDSVHVSGAHIEYLGPRLWSAWTRVLMFAVATMAGWIVLGAVTTVVQNVIPQGAGAVPYFLIACLGLFTLIGTPLLVLALLPYFCASRASLRVKRAQVSEVNRRVRGLNFLATMDGKPRRAPFRTTDAIAAREIEALLHQPPTTQTEQGEPDLSIHRPRPMDNSGQSHKTVKYVAVPAGLGFLAVLAFRSYTYLHPSKGPMPPEAIQALQSYVENDGRQPVAKDVFSMPGTTTVVGQLPLINSVQVNRVEYLYPIRVLQRDGRVPLGTVVRCYKVGDTRTAPDGLQRSESRLFYVYKDDAGKWQFLENRPVY